MYIDPFYYAVSFIIILSFLPLLFVTKNAVKGMSFESFLKIKPWISAIVYLLISAFLCMTTIFKIKYMGTLVDIVLLSVCAFGYSLVDIFYFQEIKKEYIWNLQNQFIRKNNAESLFEGITLKGTYLQMKENEKEIFSVIETENDGSCIFIGGDEKCALKPKKEMPIILLHFYAKCLSLGMKELPIFNKDDDLEQITKNYQFFKPSAIYLFIQRHKKTVKKVVFITVIVLLAAMIFYLVAGSQNWFGIKDWMNQEIG